MCVNRFKCESHIFSYSCFTFTWQNGRRLATAAANGKSLSFEYDDSGYRTQKKVNGVATDYLLDGDKIVSQIYNNQQIWFDYDAAGTRHAMEYNGNNYYYYYNLQGDVIGLYDSDLNSVVQYSYDSWGKLLSVTGSLAETVGKANPFRYRGYYYDSETELYYLNSRYYDPEMGRFVNADDSSILEEDQGEILEHNLFTYCLNNPVNKFDEDGYAAANIIGGIIGGAAGATLGYLLARRLGLRGWKKWALISAATVGGAVLGAFLGPYVAKLIKATGSTVKRAVKTLVKSELCFVAGTRILTENGHVPIENIKAGDYVYAENPETGEKGLKRVEQTFTNEINELIHVTVNSEEIHTTPGHPFYVVSKGWIGAEALEIGDQLVVYGGKRIVVEKVKHESLNKPVTVYNFEVEDFHTYYVGENSILVHNKGCGLNKLTDSYIKKTLKLNAHSIKREYLGKKAKISLYNLAVDKKTGIIYIVDRAGKIVTDTIYKTK